MEDDSKNSVLEYLICKQEEWIPVSRFSLDKIGSLTIASNATSSYLLKKQLSALHKYIVCWYSR